MKYALILVFLFSLSGCGYTNAALLPPELDSIHVSNFENMINTAKEVSDRRASYTYWPGLETDLTRAVIDGFIFDRHLSVESEEKATMTLTGELTDYHQLPLSYNNGGKDNADSVAEFRVEITVNLKLVNNITGKVMWQENNFMGQSTYNVSGANTKSESEAVRAAVKDIAQRIVERTVEAW